MRVWPLKIAPQPRCVKVKGTDASGPAFSNRNENIFSAPGPYLFARMSVLSVQALEKSYPVVRALDRVSFNVPAGSVFGILGPNGSGKTTLLGIVLGVLRAGGGGYAWFGGAEPQAARRRIGALLETPNFYPYLSAWDNLAIAARIKRRGMADRERVLQTVGLLPRAGSAFKTYSLGMKQRLAIGSALLGAPEVLVLDEPTNGLDPQGIAEVRTLIRDLAAQGTTVIMASHLLDEVERVCTHVAILKKGSLLYTGAAAGLAQQGDVLELRADDGTALLRLLKSSGYAVQADGDTLLVSLPEGTSAGIVNQQCAAAGLYCSHVALRRKTLESTFMELVK